MKNIRQLLLKVKNGSVSIEEATKQLKALPFENIGFARIDHHRVMRHGFPEVIFAHGKSHQQVREIFIKLSEKNSNVLVTHASSEMFSSVKDLPGTHYHPTAHCITRWVDHDIYGEGTILILTAGTSDLPVAEEAKISAMIMGNKVELIADVGVSGIHRVLSIQEKIMSARVIIAIAGMEGALPSVVGGLAPCPVIAVPTSVGYGTSFGGIAALLGMLNSCASNVAVVNIDNGFGAAYVASMINRPYSK